MRPVGWLLIVAPLAVTAVDLGCGGRTAGGEGSGSSGSSSGAGSSSGGISSSGVSSGGVSSSGVTGSSGGVETDDAPFEECPPPSEVGQGKSCPPGLELLCAPAVPVACSSGGGATSPVCGCSGGRWNCMADCPPPEGCPPPASLVVGAACAPPGEACPGNPTVCASGTVLYDAFVCVADSWKDVAHTICDDVDAGGIDAGTSD